MPFFSDIAERLMKANEKCSEASLKTLQGIVETATKNGTHVSSQYQKMEETLLLERTKALEAQQNFAALKRKLGAASLAATIIFGAGYFGVSNSFNAQDIINNLGQSNNVAQTVQQVDFDQIKKERDELLKEKNLRIEIDKKDDEKLQQTWNKDLKTLRSSLPDNFFETLTARFASLPDSMDTFSFENFVAAMDTGTATDASFYQFNQDAPRSAVYLQADLDKAEELFRTKAPETMTDGDIGLLKKLFKQNPQELDNVVQKVFSIDPPAASPLIQEGETIYDQARREGLPVNEFLIESNQRDIQNVVNYKRSTMEERFGSGAVVSKNMTVNGIEIYGDFSPIDFGKIEDKRTAVIALEDKLNQINTILNENNGKISLKENGNIDPLSISTINFKDVKDKDEVLKLITEYQQIFEKSLKNEYRPSMSNLSDFSGISVNIDTAKAKNNAEVQLVHWLTFPELSKENRSMLLGSQEATTPEIENAKRSVETLVALARGTNNTKTLSKEEQKEQQSRQADVITWHMQEISKAFPDVKLPEMFKAPVTTQYEMPQAEDIAVGLQTPGLMQKYNETIPSFYSEEWLKNNRSILKYMGEEKGMEKVRLGLEKYDQAVADYTSGNAYFEPTFKECAASMRLLHEAGLTAESVQAYRTLFETELAESKCVFLTGENSSPLNDIAIGRDTSQVDILQKNGKFKPLNAHITALVAATSLRSLGFEPTPERVALLGLTCQIETTGGMHDYQQGGAALGGTQFEPLTVKDMLGRALTTQKRLPHMGVILTSMNEQIDNTTFEKQLKANVASNLTMNVQMAVMHYDLRNGLEQSRLQTTLDQATRYKKDHNTDLGAATVDGAVKTSNYYKQRAKADEVLFTSFIEKVSSGVFTKKDTAPSSTDRSPILNSPKM